MDNSNGKFGEIRARLECANKSSVILSGEDAFSSNNFFLEKESRSNLPNVEPKQCKKTPKTQINENFLKGPKEKETNHNSCEIIQEEAGKKQMACNQSAQGQFLPLLFQLIGNPIPRLLFQEGFAEQGIGPERDRRSREIQASLMDSFGDVDLIIQAFLLSIDQKLENATPKLRIEEQKQFLAPQAIPAFEELIIGDLVIYPLKADCLSPE
jgi:hypothetical protein